MSQSLAHHFARLPPDERVNLIERLSEDDARALLYEWKLWARPNQLPPPGEWSTWMVLAGRGFGKTRTGGEWSRAQVEGGKCKRIALVAPTAADARDVMVEGESGILAIAPPWNRPLYEPSKRRLTWPNGAIATTYSADEPDRLRGPQHDGAWCDEVATWRYPETFDMLLFGLRLGSDPRVVVTTTPKPVPLVKQLLGRSDTAISRGSTYDNAANLAPTFLRSITSRYENTRLGRQELFAELLADTPGALWTRTMIDDLRVTQAPELIRVVVGVDPEAASDEGSAETGIIVAGVGVDGHAYVIDDMSIRGSPDTWAKAAVTAYWKHNADRLCAEVNNGGDMVEYTIRTIDRNVAYKKLHASRNKQTRAEPVAALYEQGRVHHVGFFGECEDQMTTWTPGNLSPDRMDALVWAITELMLDGHGLQLFI